MVALGSLVGRGFVRIDADTSPAKKTIMALGALGSQVGLGALGGMIAPITTAALSLASAFAVAGGAATAFGAAVVPQFQDITKAMQGQKVAEDARTKAAVNASIAQDLAKQNGFKYGEQVKITAGMTDKAKEAAQEYNSALSASDSASKSAKQSQALYKQQLDSMPKATRDTADALQALKDDTKEWSRALSSSTMPIFTRGIEFLRGLLPKLTPIVKDVSREISSFVSSLGEGTAGRVFREFGANISKNGSGMLRTLLNTIRNLSVGIVGLLNAFLPASKGVTGGLEEMTRKFAEWSAGLGKSKSFQDFLSRMKTEIPKLFTALGQLAETFGRLVVAAGPFAGLSLRIAEGLAKLLDAIPMGVLRVLVPTILAINAAFKLYAIYTAAAAGVTWLFSTAVTTSTGVTYASRFALIAHRIAMIASAIATGVMTVATYALSAAMAILTSPIGLIVIAIALLAAGFIIAWKKSETFRNIVKSALNGIKDVALAVVNWFREDFVKFFTETIPNAFRAVIDWIKEHWKLIPIIAGPVGIVVSLILTHWDKIVSGLKTALDSVIDFFKKLPGRIVGGLGDLGRLLVQKGQDILNGFWNGAKNVWSTLSTWIKQRPGAFRDALGNIVGTLLRKGQDILNGFWNGAKNVWDSVSRWVRERPGAFRDRLGGLTGTLIQKGRDILNGFWNGTKEVWSSVSSWVAGRAGAVKHWIGDVTTTLVNKGKDIIGGLWSGFKEKWSDAVDWIKGLKDKVVKAIVDVFKIGSPAKTMIPLGINIMAGLMKGILSSGKALKSAVKSIFHSITDVFKRGGSLVGDLAGKLGSAIGLGDSTAVGSAQQYAQLYMKTLGFGPSQWPALKALWQGESGWSATAHNKSSGAHGIPQALPASKMRSEGADYMTNAATQIRWGLKYIKSRYGSPSNAYSFWLRQSPHWYDTGGVARGFGFIPKLTNKPERVLSPRQTEIFENMMTAIVRGPGGAQGGGLTIENLILENHGVIGSRQELENWFVTTMETLKRKGRI